MHSARGLGRPGSDLSQQETFHLSVPVDPVFISPPSTTLFRIPSALLCRHGSVSRVGGPAVSVESTGVLKPEEIVEQALEVLIQKCTTLLTELTPGGEASGDEADAQSSSSSMDEDS